MKNSESKIVSKDCSEAIKNVTGNGKVDSLSLIGREMFGGYCLANVYFVNETEFVATAINRDGSYHAKLIPLEK